MKGRNYIKIVILQNLFMQSWSCGCLLNTWVLSSQKELLRGCTVVLVLFLWNMLKFAPISRIKKCLCEFSNFSKILKMHCKALGDFLISFLEIVHLRGCLGGIGQNSNFWNWFEILDIFRHWLLRNMIYHFIYLIWW